MKISETCTCGAKCEVEMSSSSAAAYYIKSWRQEHTHQIKTPYSYYPNISYGSTTGISSLSSQPPDATPQVA